MDITKKLYAQAQQAAKATQMMSDAKSAKNRAAGDAGASYAGLTPSQTLEWKAGDEIANLRGALQTIANGHPDIDSPEDDAAWCKSVAQSAVDRSLAGQDS